MSRNYNPASALKYPQFMTRAESIRGGSISMEEARKEYSRLRAIAQKRLQRMEGTEYEHSEIYDKYKDTFPKLADMPDELLPFHLERLSHFVGLKRSSVQASREGDKKVLESLKRANIKVTKDTLPAFGKFMEYSRENAVARLLPSDVIARTFSHIFDEKQTAKQVNANFKNFFNSIEEMYQRDVPLEDLNASQILDIMKADELLL